MFEDSSLCTGAEGQHSQEMNKTEAPRLTFKWLLVSFDVFHLCKIFCWEPQILVQQKYPAVPGRWAASAAPHGDSACFSQFPALPLQPLAYLERSRQGFSVFFCNMLNDLHGFSIFVLGDQPSRRLRHTPGAQKLSSVLLSRGNPTWPSTCSVATSQFLGGALHRQVWLYLQRK